MVLLFAFVGLARAGWESTRFCRLGDDRLLLIAGSQRFVLTHAAAWELADPSQKDAFTKWLGQSKLSKDLGQLVAGAPADHQIPLAGEVDASIDATGDTTLAFKLGNSPPKTITAAKTVDGAKLSGDGAKVFADIAKGFGKPPSTLLVALADKSGQISDSEAWGAILGRLKAKPEFFAYVDKKQGLLWIKRGETAPVTASSSPTAMVKPDEPAPTTDDQSKKPDSGKSNSGDLLLPVLIGVVALIVGGAGGYWASSQRPVPQPRQAAPTPAGPAQPRFSVTSNERELVEKVRDEIRKLGWSADHVPSADEAVVGQRIDRYDRHPFLREEIERLQTYRRFKEDHDAFQKQIDGATAAAKASAGQSLELSNQLEKERAKTQALADELRRVQTVQLATAAEQRKNVEFQQVYVELVNRTSAVCHDIVITRPRGDAWALAFAYLVDYTLAYLGLARQCGDVKTFEAMLTNLSRLSDAMAKSFPDRKLVIDPWQRAVKAFGNVKLPSYEPKPHPHVDSLSQIVLTLRDTGPSLSEFREFFAPSETGLHIIRPA